MFSAQKPRSGKSWTNFLIKVDSASLTLIGFEEQDLPKLHDALDACSTLKGLQSVEVFIHTLEEVQGFESTIPRGLCLVRVPEPKNKKGYRLAKAILRKLSGDNMVTIVPVIAFCGAGEKTLKAIVCFCPFYINANSEMRDFAVIFSTFLFSEFAEQATSIEPLTPFSRPSYKTV